jgi:hypothetical protein
VYVVEQGERFVTVEWSRGFTLMHQAHPFARAAWSFFIVTRTQNKNKLSTAQLPEDL